MRVRFRVCADYHLGGASAGVHGDLATDSLSRLHRSVVGSQTEADLVTNAGNHTFILSDSPTCT